MRCSCTNMKHTATLDRPAPVLVTLSQRARTLRQQRGLTLRRLADRSGLSLRFLMDVEAGRGNISVRRLADLAAALETTAADLVTAHTEAPMPRVIALLGLRGAGKTTVGRRLARRLKRRFVELDRQIETRAGLTLSEIFSLHGEEYYRRLEREELERVLVEGRPVVLATGGGLVTSPATYQALRRGAFTVWLRASPEDHWNRVVQQGDRRPMADHPQAMAELRRLLAMREPLYGEAAHVIDTSRSGIEGSVSAVARLLAR